MMFVPEALRKAADIFEQRNALYKDNYKKFGKWVAPLLQDRVMPKTEEEWGRFAYLLLMLHKVSRIVEQFHEGGHRDSNDDLAVYAMMLSELEEDAKRAEDIRQIRYTKKA